MTPFKLAISICMAFLCLSSAPPKKSNILDWSWWRAIHLETVEGQEKYPRDLKVIYHFSNDSLIIDFNGQKLFGTYKEGRRQSFTSFEIPFTKPGSPDSWGNRKIFESHPEWHKYFALINRTNSFERRADTLILHHDATNPFDTAHPMTYLLFMEPDDFTDEEWNLWMNPK